MPTIQKPKMFTFKMNDGTNFIGTDKTREGALMRHLELKTRKLGHQITYSEALDSAKVTMVHPNEFVGPFSSFDEAAETAWRRVRPSDSTGLTEEGKKLVAAMRATKAK